MCTNEEKLLFESFQFNYDEIYRFGSWVVNERGDIFDTLNLFVITNSKLNECSIEYWRRYVSEIKRCEDQYLYDFECAYKKVIEICENKSSINAKSNDNAVREIARMQCEIDCLEHYIINMFSIVRKKEKMLFPFYKGASRNIDHMVSGIVDGLYELIDLKSKNNEKDK